MDIVRSKSDSGRKKKLLLGAVLVAAVSLTLYSFVYGSSATYGVDSSTLLTDTVQQGELTVTVRGMGVLAPKDIRWLT